YLASAQNGKNFTGKVVLVTGSSTGIGEGIAKLFALLGARVVVTGRNVSRIQSVAQDVQQLSPQRLEPLQVVADLKVDADIERLVKTTIDTYGRLDVLVNNAGIYPVDTIRDDIFMPHWDDVFQTNLRPMVKLVNLALPYLQKFKGNVVDISSVAGIDPPATQLAYGTSKATVMQLSRVLALELGPLGVRVNTINPGAVAVQHIVEEFTGALDVVVPQTPLRRYALPLDIAKAAVFLASDDAAFITGTNIVVDGGLEWNYP
ncbi:unnamed protein product, partial [Medioppia subpectinata]